MTIKFVDHSFVHNLKICLNIKQRLRIYLFPSRQKSCQVKTAVHTDHCTRMINLVEFGKFIFRQHIEGQQFCISIGHVLVSFIVTSLQFPSWRCPFNSKCQNALWSDEYSVHKNKYRYTLDVWNACQR